MINVTIAIPVYNVEKYVEKSVLSALNQDFEGSYEILIIDDCGSDCSMDLVDRLVKEHPKGNIVRIVKHSQNMGLGPARNTAIDNAKGEYLYFLDSDDWMSPDCIKVMFNAAKRYSSEIVAASVSEVNESTGKESWRYHYTLTKEFHPHAGVQLQLKGNPIHIEAWNKLVKLDFLRKNKIYTVHRIMEDSVYSFNSLVRSSRIVLIPNLTYYYNIRENSILTSIFGGQSSDESIFVYCDIVKKIQEDIRQNYLNVKGVYDLYIAWFMAALFGMSRSSQTERQKEMIDVSFSNCLLFIPGKRSLISIYNRIFFEKNKEQTDRNQLIFSYRKVCKWKRRLSLFNPVKLYHKILRSFS